MSFSDDYYEELELLDSLTREEIEAINDHYISEFEIGSILKHKEIEDINDEVLMHYGVGADDNPPGRGSGRYEKGSGENPDQHQTGLRARVNELKKKGLTEKEIAEYLQFRSTDQLRARLSIEKTENKLYLAKKIPELSKTMNNSEIARQLGISEGTVRNYLNENHKIQLDKTTNVANMLKEELKTKHYIDVGPGVELECNLSKERMKTALEMLKEDGYKVYYIQVEQMGIPGQKTTVKVLGDPESDWKAVREDPTLIQNVNSYVENDGEKIRFLLPPESIDSKRVYINYTNPDGSGGAEKDGLIELRRGVEDISLGRSLYSQVRIAVDGTHYMKGMALYSDNIPDGYDVVYNTNKKVGTDKYDVYKKMETDKDGNINQENPFGAAIKPLKAGGQAYILDENGNPTDKLRVINKVNDQGDWGNWSKTISSQVLAKQPYPLVKKQLDLTYKDRVDEFNEIKSLTNPTIKKELLESFADDCDASAVHLKAKAFPGQGTHAIIPITSLKDDECYAPNYEHGDQLALIRYPHAGRFEIPIVRCNKYNREALSVMKNAPDAIGINAHVAEVLSGADFDGDTVVAIPLKSANIKSEAQLKGLRNFNTKDYKIPDVKRDSEGNIIDPRVMSPRNKQIEMGKITNLIADMTVKGCDADEITRAVKHSMVVIDSVKHELDYKQSFKDNRIQELKNKYQNGGGATTLLTRAKNEMRIPARKPGHIVDEETGERYYKVDPRTGKKIWENTGETYEKKSPTNKDPDRTVTVVRQEKIPRMAYVEDARDLLSSKTNPHPNEVAYATYANQMKALANEARKEIYKTPSLKRDPKAAKEYAEEVDSLKRKLSIAQKNAPRERKAQIIANALFKSEIESNPDIKNDKDKVKRIRGQSIKAARDSVGAKKIPIEITDREWEAIQAHAISETKLREILKNTDGDALRKRATPRPGSVLTPTEEHIIRTMASRDDVTIKDIANRLGVSTSTVSNVLNKS